VKMLTPEGGERSYRSKMRYGRWQCDGGWRKKS
jgi:hypothetical protein